MRVRGFRCAENLFTAGTAHLGMKVPYKHAVAHRINYRGAQQSLFADWAFHSRQPSLGRYLKPLVQTLSYQTVPTFGFWPVRLPDQEYVFLSAEVFVAGQERLVLGRIAVDNRIG